MIHLFCFVSFVILEYWFYRKVPTMSSLVPFNNGPSSMQSAMQQVVVARMLNSSEDEQSREMGKQMLTFVASLSTETVGNSVVRVTESFVSSVERLSKIDGVDPTQISALLGVNIDLQKVFVDIAQRGAKHL